MPREPKELIRKSGFREAEKLFILSYEGTLTEKKYFENFRNSNHFNDNGLIETIPLKRPKGSGSDPISVKRLLKQAKEAYNFKRTDEFWLIIDRDHWEEIHHHNFDELIEDCKKEGNFYVAMSNPCFEIWLVLHLKDMNEFSDEEKMLLMKNNRFSSKKHHIDKVLENLIDDGRGYNKKPDPKIFLPRLDIAIQRAKKLDYNKEDYPTSLGSHVYKLIEKLKK